MSKRARTSHPLYQRFLDYLGVSYDEFNQMLANELDGLTEQEQRTIMASDLDRPETWTEEQQCVFRKMFARAATKAKRRDEMPKPKV